MKNTHPYLPNKIYDILKWIAFMVIPTISAAAVAVSEIWGVTLHPTIIAVFTTVSTIIGVVLTISSSNYTIATAMAPAPRIVEVYQALQELTLYWLPAVTSVYYVVSLVFTVPYPGEVIKTLVTVNVFLSIVLGTYSSQTDNLLKFIQDKVRESMDNMAKRWGTSK